MHECVWAAPYLLQSLLLFLWQGEITHLPNRLENATGQGKSCIFEIVWVVECFRHQSVFSQPESFPPGYRREDAFRRREDALRKKDLELQESLIKFNKFLQAGLNWSCWGLLLVGTNSGSPVLLFDQSSVLVAAAVQYRNVAQVTAANPVRT